MTSLGHAIAENKKLIISDKVGQVYFNNLLNYVIETLRADIAIVGYLDEVRRDRIQTLSVVKDGEIQENFEYLLKGAPCENVIEGAPCFYATKVQQEFPDDKFLQEKGIDSYVGILLIDAGNESIGLLLALSRQPFPDREFALNIMNFFANRAAAELERRLSELELENKIDLQTENLRLEIADRERTQYALKDMMHRFRDVATISSDWIWETDENLRFTYFSDRINEVYGWEPGTGIGLTRMEILEAGHWELDAAILHQQEQAMMEHETFRNCESRVTIPGRGDFYISTSGAAYFDEHGNFRGYRGTCSDITDRKLSEIALQQSETRFKKLYNETPVMMHSIDRNGVIHEVSDYWLEIMGYDRSEIIGKSGLDLMTEESRTRALEENIPNFFQTGHCVDVPYQLIKKSGEIIDVLLSAHGECDSEGKVVKSEARMVDVTERFRYESLLRRKEQLLSESSEKFRVLLDSAADAIFVMDISDSFTGRIVSANKAACDSLGYTNAELMKMSVPDFEVGLSQHQRDNNYNRLGNGRFSTLHGVHQRKDGSQFPVSIRSSIVEVNGRRLAMAIARDETVRTNYEKKLKRAKNNAEKAKMDAVKANKAKSEFLANMSHELRTPLNAIIGFSDVMLHGETSKNLSQDQQTEYLNHIHESGLHLLNLISDMLDCSSIEAGKLALRPDLSNIRELINGAFSLVHRQFKSKRIGVKIKMADELPFITIDALRIKQVLINLLNNAAKYTPFGGEVKVHVSLSTADKIEISIQDSGPGMSDEEIDIALQRFGRTSCSASTEGTGLGLPLAKELILAHGGSMNIISEIGVGTKVTIELPVDGGIMRE